ncbi:MAG: hypothetical protein AAGG51_14650, partial [Cyanobacteria bacterium P01_G01_bin.54]
LRYGFLRSIACSAGILPATQISLRFLCSYNPDSVSDSGNTGASIVDFAEFRPSCAMSAYPELTLIYLGDFAFELICQAESKSHVPFCGVSIFFRV